MHPAGYKRQRQESTVKVLSPLRQIEIKAVTRNEVIGQTLAVTASMAPAAVDFLGHIRFPLKHEEVEELAILANRLKRIEPESACRFSSNACT